MSQIVNPTTVATASWNNWHDAYCQCYLIPQEENGLCIRLGVPITVVFPNYKTVGKCRLAEDRKKTTRKWVFEYPLAMSVGNGFRRWEGIKVRNRVTSSTTPLSPQALLKLSLSLHREKSIRTQPAMVTCREKSLCSQPSMVTQDYTLWNWQADPRGWQVPGKFELPREALSGIFVLR